VNLQNKSRQRLWGAFLLLALTLIIAACGPAVPATPTPEETEASEAADTTTTEEETQDEETAAETAPADEEAAQPAQPAVPESEPPTAVDPDEYAETDSGIRYAVLTPGDGEMPELGEIAAVNFKGWLEDDTLFAASQPGVPVEFIVGEEQIIPGWDEAVQLMEVGETTQFVIPPELALGETGSGDGFIPPDATLTFELELVSVSPPPPTPTPAPPPTSVDEEDYTVTDSGLKYYVLEEGDGDEVEEGDSVAVHYRLWLEDGTQIDSSYDRGAPFEFIVGAGQTIPGWDEGVALLKQGDVAQFVLPPELAYGETGSGPIPPNANLIFEVEVVAVNQAVPR